MGRSARLEKRFEHRVSTSMFIHAWYTYREELHRRAVVARGHGVSWRTFFTGQSSLCVERSGRYRIIDSANFKPTQCDHPRHCAEEEALEVSTDEGLVIIGMALAAEPQPDDRTGIHIGFLVPCGKTCLPRIVEEVRNPSGVIKPYSWLRLIDATSSKRYCELQVYELVQLWDNWLASENQEGATP